MEVYERLIVNDERNAPELVISGMSIAQCQTRLLALNFVHAPMIIHFNCVMNAFSS